MDNGYIRLYRKLLEDPIYKKPLILQLWVHLLLSVNHKETKILWNGEEITIQPGQVVTGREKLAKSTGQTTQNIRTGLKALKSTSKLTIKTYSKFSIITINKWEEYQRANHQSNQQLTSNQPATNQQLTTNNNDKKEKNDKKNIYIEEFETLWKQYPNKSGKSKALKSFEKVPQTRLQDFTKAFHYYVEKVQGKELEFIKNGSTFFNQWEDVFIEAKENNGNGNRLPVDRKPEWHRCEFCKASDGIITISGNKVKCPHGDTSTEIREKLRKGQVNV